MSETLEAITTGLDESLESTKWTAQNAINGRIGLENGQPTEVSITGENQIEDPKVAESMAYASKPLVERALDIINSGEVNTDDLSYARTPSGETVLNELPTIKTEDGEVHAFNEPVRLAEQATREAQKAQKQELNNQALELEKKANALRGEANLIN